MTYLRRADERGKFDFGWLKTSHTFSFGQYYDPEHVQFGNLRVINEDFIAGGEGFGTHPHRDMEIITYVVKGQVNHKDSMGNEGAIIPGDIQKMTAGTGILHSEFNGLNDEQTHLFQIWIMPKANGLTPGYAQVNFKPEEKTNKIALMASDEEGEAKVHLNANAKMYSSILEAGNEQEFEASKYKKVFIQLVRGNIEVNGNTLTGSDAIGLDETKLSIKAKAESEFILFELE
jgi:redox-sensitive bicupin YhaK (pirin superfamily)